MSSFSEDFKPFVRRMKGEHLPDIVIDNFRYYYQKLREGQTGLIPETDIVPVESLTDAEALPPELKEIGRQNIRKTVMIKLNGGLGTSMGLDKAKSLITVKKSLSFLDIIIQQAYKLKVPVIFMNSFSTREDTLEALESYPDMWGDFPADFMQYKVPKVDQTDLSPVKWPGDPDLEWCPPGHGEIYTALATSGMLDKLLTYGYTYAFVSNADNLGAVVDLSILGYFAQNALPFMMEAAENLAETRERDL